jgi:hypothetical protein
MDAVSLAELMHAAGAGTVLDCMDGEIRRVVDAALIRRCCREMKTQIDPHGIQLRNAAVHGSVDIAGIDVRFPLRFDGCEFDAPFVAEGAVLRELALIGCVRLPGLLANGLRVRRDLDLSRSYVTGAHFTSASTSKRSAIWLCESDIGGRLLCWDTVIAADGERAMQADRMHVGGTVRFIRQFTAHGQIRLAGIHVGGSVDLTGAHIDAGPGEAALDLGDAIIGGSVFLASDASGRQPVIGGRVDMSSAQISGQLLIRNAILSERAGTPIDSGHALSRIAGTAVSAPRLSVGAEVTIEGACEVAGGIDLSMGELSSVSIGKDCSLRAPGRTAVDLTNAELRSSLRVDGAVVEGTLRLTGARIQGKLSLTGAAFSKPGGNSLIAAQGVAVDGDVELQGLRTEGGQVGFRAATLGSVIDAAGAQLHNPDGYTLSLHQANVRGSVRLVDGFSSDGAVILNRITLDGRLQCTDGRFNCPAPSARDQRRHAIEAISATIRGGIDLGWKSISPSVEFTNARTTFLADDPARWPERFMISGFSYDRFEYPERAPRTSRLWDPAPRCRWLNAQAAYDAGPYEQAARVFREHGYPREAEQILIAQVRHARRAITGRGAVVNRILNLCYDVTVRFGYRPGRVVWAIIVLLAAVAISSAVPANQAAMRATSPGDVVYTPHGAGQPSGLATTPAAQHDAAIVDACGEGKVRCYNPVFYAVDTVVPLISLDQRSTWYPDPHVPRGTFMQWWLNIATLLGWLLSSIFVLSLARLARSS